MDPTVLLKNALEACSRNDKERAAEDFENLAAWLRKGGFPPEMDEVWFWVDATFDPRDDAGC